MLSFQRSTHQSRSAPMLSAFYRIRACHRVSRCPATSTTSTPGSSRRSSSHGRRRRQPRRYRDERHGEISIVVIAACNRCCRVQHHRRPNRLARDLRFLRHPSRPNAPRPVANGGSAAEAGTTALSILWVLYRGVREASRRLLFDFRPHLVWNRKPACAANYRITNRVRSDAVW
jgi:hypothetical protein